MKTIEPQYMVLKNNGVICFTTNIQYYENNLYICTTHDGNKSIISSSCVFKFTPEVLDRFIRVLHDSIHNEKTHVFSTSSIDDMHTIELFIYPSGLVASTTHSCSVYCPRNCLKWDNVCFINYLDGSYVLKRCNTKGGLIQSRSSKINPNSNNCRIIYDIIKKNPSISTYEIIDELSWPPNSVTSRLSELMACSMIRSVGRVTNPHSGRWVHKWAITESTGE